MTGNPCGKCGGADPMCACRSFGKEVVVPPKDVKTDGAKPMATLHILKGGKADPSAPAVRADTQFRQQMAAVLADPNVDFTNALLLVPSNGYMLWQNPNALTLGFTEMAKIKLYEIMQKSKTQND